MKKQKPLFKVGDIVKNSHKKWERMIADIKFEERGDTLKVMYYYYNQELNKLYEPTGNFDKTRIGFCSQDHILSWSRGR